MVAIRRLRVQRKKRPFVFFTLLSLSLSLTFYSLFTILPSAERGYTLRLEMYTILFLVCLYDFASPPPHLPFLQHPSFISILCGDLPLLYFLFRPF